MTFLEFNQDAKIIVNTIGNSNIPLIIIDNFAVDISVLLDYLKQKSQFYVDKQSAYPGLKSLLPKQYIEALASIIYRHLYRIYQVPQNLRIECPLAFAGMLATPPEALTVAQRLPHYDTPRPYYFAALHYLTDDDQGGTGFFRHISTGTERVTPQNEQAYFVKLKSEIDQPLGLPQGYPTVDNDLFECYHQIDYKPNRLLIYPGNAIHSGLVTDATQLTHDPTLGRITGNVFFEYI